MKGVSFEKHLVAWMLDEIKSFSSLLHDRQVKSGLKSPLGDQVSIFFSFYRELKD